MRQSIRIIWVFQTRTPTCATECSAKSDTALDSVYRAAWPPHTSRDPEPTHVAEYDTPGIGNPSVPESGDAAEVTPISRRPADAERERRGNIEPDTDGFIDVALNSTQISHRAQKVAEARAPHRVCRRRGRRPVADAVISDALVAIAVLVAGKGNDHLGAGNKVGAGG